MNRIPAFDAASRDPQASGSDGSPSPIPRTADSASTKALSPAEQNAAHDFEHTLHAIVQAQDKPAATEPEAPESQSSGHASGTGSASGSLHKAAKAPRTSDARGLHVSAAEAMIAHLAPANVKTGATSIRVTPPAPHYLQASQVAKLPGQTAASEHAAAGKHLSSAQKLEAARKAPGETKGADQDSSSMTAALAAARGTDSSAKPALADPATAITPPALPPAVPASALTSLGDDALIRGNLMPHAARLLINAGEAGNISLQLKVKDGQADLRVEGKAAHLLAGQMPELQRVLAKEGVTLNNMDVATQPQTPQTGQQGSGQNGNGQQGAPREDPEAPERRAPLATPASNSNRSSKGLHHVKA